MVIVVEVAEETQAVELVVGVSVVQLAQTLQLLQASLVPETRLARSQAD